MIKQAIKILLVVGVMLLAISGVSATSYEQEGDLRITNTYYFTNQEYHILDFEDANLQVGSQYEREGVTFFGAHSKTIRHDSYNREGAGTASGEYSIGNSANDRTTSENVPFEIEFENGARAIGFYLGNGAYGNERGVSAEIIVHDTSNRVLGILREDNVPNSVTRFVGFTSLAGPIGRVTIDYGNTLLSEAIDDLMWVEANNYESIGSTCSDSDGNNLYTKNWAEGWNSYNNKNVRWGDYCTQTALGAQTDSGVYIHEAVCRNGEVEYQDPQRCPTGYSCSNGACERDTQQQADNLDNFRCTDTDGTDIYTKGYVRGLDYYGEKILDEADTCAQYDGGAETNRGDYVIELVCGADEKQVATYKRCASGYTCSYGKCVQETRVLPANEDSYLCGDSYGGDGYYVACEQDTIEHKEGIEIYVHDIKDDMIEIKVLNQEYYDIMLGETLTLTFNGISYEVEYNLYEEDTNRATLYVREKGTARENTSSVVVTNRDSVRVTQVTNPNAASCGGCQENGNCLPYGTRLLEQGTPVYCSVEGKLATQLSFESSCQNDYECLSNQCSNGQCVDYGKEIGKTNNLLESLLNWLGSIF